MLISNKNYILSLLLKTWEKDIDGIFDYGSNSFKEKEAFINESFYIVRTKNDLIKKIYQHSDIQTKLGDDLLFKVNNCKNDIFSLMNPIPKKLNLTEENTKYLNNKLWYIVKSDFEDNDYNNQDYLLNENDIIKLGSLKFAVQEIHKEYNINFKNESEPPIPILNYDIYNLNRNLPPVFDFIFEVKHYYNKNLIDNNKSANEYDNSNNINIIKCTICSKAEINDDDFLNPLISLCQCEQLVHYKCLKQKISETKIIKNEEDNNCVKTIIINEFDCEICKTQFPLRFKLPDSNKVFYLINIKRPINCDYIILESLDCKKDNRFIKTIHIISLLKEYINIGRDSDNDIIELDCSISRKHSVIKYIKDNKNIILENRSKNYGTLVLIRKPINILEQKICLQIGRPYVEAKLMKMKEFEKLKLDNI